MILDISFSGIGGRSGKCMARYVLGSDRRPRLLSKLEVARVEVAAGAVKAGKVTGSELAGKVGRGKWGTSGGGWWVTVVEAVV